MQPFATLLPAEKECFRTACISTSQLAEDLYLPSDLMQIVLQYFVPCHRWHDVYFSEDLIVSHDRTVATVTKDSFSTYSCLHSMPVPQSMVGDAKFTVKIHSSQRPGSLERGVYHVGFVRLEDWQKARYFRPTMAINELGHCRCGPTTKKTTKLVNHLNSEDVITLVINRQARTLELSINGHSKGMLMSGADDEWLDGTLYFYAALNYEGDTATLLPPTET
eukprot:TRINITY_DN15047_c0_g1_i1.p1 TRINITY_DN15047_c0_g1~~TRINITY_DN15047_c0_g1_i1.p1  ORF type:complete len:221 (-),score=1.58 TRINITY_DN15047_c0_g1_i1:70-732(-)